MQYQKEPNVICFGDTKQAALYFDRIFPVSFILKDLIRLPAFDNYLRRNRTDIKSKKHYEELKLEAKKIVNELSSTTPILSELLVLENLLGHPNLNDLNKLVGPLFNALLSNMYAILVTMKLYSNQNRLNTFPKSAVKRFEYMYKSGKPNHAINRAYEVMNNMIDLLSIFYAQDVQIEFISRNKSIRSVIDVLSRKWAGKCGQVLIPSFCITSNEATESDVSLSLDNINLIDTSKAKWEQIIEYRKDEVARKKLRNLRLFLYTNYQGKSRAFIEDDLGKRLDEYYDTCKDWGFETLTSTISVVMDSENLISLLVGSTCATLFGGPVAGLIAGASIEVGNISLNIAKRKHAFNKLKRDHDLAYIIEAKERFKNTS